MNEILSRVLRNKMNILNEDEAIPLIKGILSDEKSSIYEVEDIGQYGSNTRQTRDLKFKDSKLEDALPDSIFMTISANKLYELAEYIRNNSITPFPHLQAPVAYAVLYKIEKALSAKQEYELMKKVQE